ncbi:FtsZ-interacting cell division protein ZipA [Herbaspirillum seropedicae]
MSARMWGRKKPALRPVFSENNPKITWPERLQPALHQQPERQRQQALRQQPEQRRQPAWQRQQQERRQPALHQQPEQQRPELQQQEQQQVPELLPSCRKQPGQQPTTKRSTESFS